MSVCWKRRGAVTCGNEEDKWQAERRKACTTGKKKQVRRKTGGTTGRKTWTKGTKVPIPSRNRNKGPVYALEKNGKNKDGLRVNREGENVGD